MCTAHRKKKAGGGSKSASAHPHQHQAPPGSNRVLQNLEYIPKVIMLTIPMDSIRMELGMCGPWGSWGGGWLGPVIGLRLDGPAALPLGMPAHRCPMPGQGSVVCPPKFQHCIAQLPFADPHPHFLRGMAHDTLPMTPCPCDPAPSGHAQWRNLMYD